MTELTGRVALVTGAGGGIGQALCRLLATRGASIIALDRTAELAQAGVEATANAAALPAMADITDRAAVRAAINAATDSLGAVDILVNNAGGAGTPTLGAMTPEAWARDLATNLSGAYHVTDTIIARMQERGRGAIVNIASVNGLLFLGHPAYSAAKAGLISYTKALAVEYGRYGIRANCICPGTVRTPIWAERVARNPKIFETLKKWYPLGRVAEPIDVAEAVAFLASDRAGAITGAVLTVDCGLTAGNAPMASELTLEQF